MGHQKRDLKSDHLRTAGLCGGTTGPLQKEARDVFPIDLGVWKEL